MIERMDKKVYKYNNFNYLMGKMVVICLFIFAAFFIGMVSSVENCLYHPGDLENNYGITEIEAGNYVTEWKTYEEIDIDYAGRAVYLWKNGENYLCETIAGINYPQKWIPFEFPTSGLVARWSFENNFDDSTGHGFNGVEQGGVTFAPGQVGMAANFDGNNYIEIPNSASTGNALDIEGSLTIAAWVKITGSGSSSVMHILGKRNGCASGSADIQYQLAYNSGDFSVGSTIGGAGAGSYGSNTWYFVVGTFDSSDSSMKIYIDGTQVGLTTRTSNDMLPSILQSVLIGTSGTCEKWIGYIDEVAVWDRPLSSTEITRIYDFYKKNQEIITQYSLTINRNGPGTITSTSNPLQNDQINCGSGCTTQTINYNSGTAVTITGIGYRFTGGISGCTDDRDTCTIIMDNPQSIYAES